MITLGLEDTTNRLTPAHIKSTGGTVTFATNAPAFPDKDICQWHWGAYASKDNDALVLYEDDNGIWKLKQPWTNFDVEPYFGVTQNVCSPPG